MSTRIKKAIFLVLIVGAALAVTGFAVNSRRNHNKKITVVYDENAGQSDDAATKVVTAKGTETIQTLLKDNGYTIDKDIYAYSVNLNKRASDASKVTITKKAKGMLIVGDQTQYYSTAKKTIGGMLAEKNITVGQNDIVTPSESSAMNTTVKKVQVVRVTQSTVTSEATLPYETKVVTSSSVPQGTVKVLQSGSTGVQSIKTVVTRHNDVVVSEKEQSKDIKKVANAMTIQVNPADAKVTSKGLKTAETQQPAKETARQETVGTTDAASSPASTAAEQSQTPKESGNTSSDVKADEQSKQPTENKSEDKNTNSEEEAKREGNAEPQTTKLIIEKVSIPFETEKLNLIANENLKIGEKKVTTAGVNGEKEVTKKVTYQDGKVIKEVVDKEVITKNPITEVVSIGVEDPEKKSLESDASSKTTHSDADSQANNNGTQAASGTTTTTDNAPASVSPSDGATTSSATQATTSGAAATPTSATTAAKPAAVKAAPVQKVAVKTTAATSSSNLSASGTAALKNGAIAGHKTSSLSGAHYNLVCAVVAAEDNTSYTGALAVTSCIMNRSDSGRWGGKDPISVIKSPNQFSAYQYGNYKKYDGGKAPSYVKEAVSDCMTYGLRNHSYTSFRAGYASGYKKIGGNYYF